MALQLHGTQRYTVDFCVALSRPQDADQTAKYWEDLKKKTEPILADPGLQSFPFVTEYLQVYMELQEQIEGAVAGMQAAKGALVFFLCQFLN